MAVPMKGKDGMVVGEWRVEPLNKTINNITYTSSHTPYNNNGDPWPLTHSGMYLKLSRGEGIPNQAAFHKQWSLQAWSLFSFILHRHLHFDAGLVSPVAPWTPTPAGEGRLSMNSHLFDWSIFFALTGPTYSPDLSSLVTPELALQQGSNKPLRWKFSSFISAGQVLVCLRASDPAPSGVRDRHRERRPDDAYRNFFQKYNTNLDTLKLNLNAPKAGREEDEERPVQKQASREDRKV